MEERDGLGGIHILVPLSFYLETLCGAVSSCEANDPTCKSRFRFLNSHYKHFPSDLQQWTSALSAISKDLCFMHMRPAGESLGTLDDLYARKWSELKSLATVDDICATHRGNVEHREQFTSAFNALVRSLRTLNSMHISTLNLPSLEVDREGGRHFRTAHRRVPTHTLFYRATFHVLILALVLTDTGRHSNTSAAREQPSAPTPANVKAEPCGQNAIVDEVPQHPFNPLAFKRRLLTGLNKLVSMMVGFL
jgi:hypothetical protein